MEAQERFEHWLDIANYDLETADSMHSSKRWIYVIFMCQQAIEKLAKGLYTFYIDDNVPRVHNINAIINKFEDQLPQEVPDEIRILFDKLTAYYLNNRYPDYMARLSSQTNHDEATEILAKSKEAFKWLLTLKTSTK